jgi:hypothetical protein
MDSVLSRFNHSAHDALIPNVAAGYPALPRGIPIEQPSMGTSNHLCFAHIEFGHARQAFTVSIEGDRSGAA